MSWEVLTMKSRTSFFNGKLAKNMLQRSWPAWLLFFVVLLLELPIYLLQSDWAWGQERLDWVVLERAAHMSTLLYVCAVLAAMVQFYYLYFPRSCGLMNALPLRRGTVYWTAFLTGFGAMLFVEVLTVLVTLLLAVGHPLRFASLLQWLAVAAGTTLAGYGFAAFCAMLTGNLLVLPAVYFIFNCLVAVLCGMLNNIFLRLLYGFGHFSPAIAVYLSPMIALDDLLTYISGENTIHGLYLVAIYAALGLVFAILGRLLYQKRRMECATDAVAIPFLKPVFSYCMAIGTALMLAGSYSQFIPTSELSGRTSFLLTLGALLLGAVVGWLAARMLLQKSFRVFRSGWGGCLICCAFLALGCIGIECNITGFETRVPEASEVRWVTLWDRTLSDVENVASVVGLHRSLIAHKSDYDAGPRRLAENSAEDAYIGSAITIRYNLRDGSTLERYYHVVTSASQAENPGSDLARYTNLMNEPEAIESASIPQLPVTAETLSAAYLEGDADGVHWNYNLNTEQALELYETAILPEIRSGVLGRYEPFRGYYDAQPLPEGAVDEPVARSLIFSLNLRASREDYPDLREDGAAQVYRVRPGSSEYFEYKSYNIPLNASLTRAWVNANTPYTVDTEP